MNARRAGPWVAAALALIGGVCVGVRAYHRKDATLDKGESLWRITYRAKFTAARAGARIRFTVPDDTPHARVFHEDVLYSGLAAQRLKSSRPMAREVSLVARRQGGHSLTARFDLHISPADAWRMDADRPRAGETWEQYLRATPNLPVEDAVVRQTVEDLRRSLVAGTDMVQRIYEHCASEMAPDEMTHEALLVLRRRQGSSLGRARAMVTLCRAARIPARLVAGFKIEALRGTELQHRFWVETMANNRWTSHDPAAGLARGVPHTYLPVRREGIEIVRGTDITDLETSFTIAPLPPGPGASRIGRRDAGVIFDLTRLPLEMHDVLSIILLMPLGALVTSIFRTVIGVRTFGTFTPTLLALSFVYAEPFNGLVTFAVVIVLGLISRSFLERLKLLMVPRLSVVLTLVTLCIVLTVSVLDYFDLTPSAQAVILPLVILTMTIERFYLTSEEDSPAFALQLLATTVAIGACCYAVLRWKTVGKLVFAFPEVHFFTIAALILLGRYSGYRLTELYRFRDLMGGKNVES